MNGLFLAYDTRGRFIGFVSQKRSWCSAFKVHHKHGLFWKSL